MTVSLAELRKMCGKEAGLSEWLTIDQDMVNAFADITRDWNFIHVDPERAAGTPFGGTIAHGFLTLSLLSSFAYEAMPAPEGAKAVVNYGMNRLRFIAPVKVGSRVRGRFSLVATDDSDPERIKWTYAVEVEIEGSDRPALSAEWVSITFH